MVKSGRVSDDLSGVCEHMVAKEIKQEIPLV